VPDKKAKEGKQGTRNNYAAASWSLMPSTTATKWCQQGNTSIYVDWRWAWLLPNEPAIDWTILRQLQPI
jgi:hypothetical protein